MNEQTDTNSRILEFDRVFTLEEANATLPLVKVIVRDLATLSRELLERRERLSFLSTDRDVDRQDPYSEELAQVELDLKQDESRFDEYLDELHTIQAIPREGPEGEFDEVDFPSTLENRPVLLCWRLGESQIQHWHEIDGDFDDREPISPSLAGSDQ